MKILLNPFLPIFFTALVLMGLGFGLRFHGGVSTFGLGHPQFPTGKLNGRFNLCQHRGCPFWPLFTSCRPSPSIGPGKISDSLIEKGSLFGTLELGWILLDTISYKIVEKHEIENWKVPLNWKNSRFIQNSLEIQYL